MKFKNRTLLNDFICLCPPQLEVRAFDLGTPQLDDSQTIQIQVIDIDDHPPTFDRDLYPPPYVTSVLEEHSNVYVANLSLATDPDIGNNSIICYYITGVKVISAQL